MGSVNKVILVGYVGKDPELKQTNSGKSVCKLSLATTFGENTEWHSVVCWNKLADVASKYARKGKQVYVEGRIQTRTYEDKEGQTRYITEVVAQNMTLLGKKDSDGSEYDNTAPAAPEGW